MKISDKYHWGEFIYNLIYPGFVGSMVYELIPSTKGDADYSAYFVLPTLIKFLITVFYCVDYLHLYGDMHTRVKPNQRDWSYLFCDVASSLFFFLAFVMVKLNHFQFALCFIALIPLFFSIYKRKNEADKKFHIPYLTLSILVAIVSLLSINKVFEIKLIDSSSVTLCWFVALSLTAYCTYVFGYYDKYSKPIDIKLFGSKTNNTE